MATKGLDGTSFSLIATCFPSTITYKSPVLNFLPFPVPLNGRVSIPMDYIGLWDGLILWGILVMLGVSDHNKYPQGMSTQWKWQCLKLKRSQGVQTGENPQISYFCWIGRASCLLSDSQERGQVILLLKLHTLFHTFSGLKNCLHFFHVPGEKVYSKTSIATSHQKLDWYWWPR